MGIRKIDNYSCKKCYRPYGFPQAEYISISHKCPNCGGGMDYCDSEDVDIETNKVVNRYSRIPKKDIDIKEIMTGISSIECPYCHSKDTKKISTTSKAINTAIFGFLGTKRYKQWHCNKCGSDF